MFILLAVALFFFFVFLLLLLPLPPRSEPSEMPVNNEARPPPVDRPRVDC